MHFTQEEVERALADVLKHGDRVDVARISGLSESYIKRQFNPDDHEAACCGFRILQIACALDQISEEAGEKFWRTLSSFREMSKILNRQGVDLDIETGILGKEVAEFMNARLSKRSIREQVRELIDVKQQVDKIGDKFLVEEKIN